MAIYAVGDLQGCLAPLERLLERVRFDPAEDRLWLVGDLVNRGPASGNCLRYVHDLGSAAVTVLGNHDLHLLATAAGLRPPRPRDTLKDVLQRPDAEELLEWLAARPLIHHDTTLGWTLVHAGIPPQWHLEQACTEARAVEQVLQAPQRRDEFLARMYGDTPDRWDDALKGMDRLRYTVNALTRMRFIRRDGGLDLKESGPPGSVPSRLSPWFEVGKRRMGGQPIVFGHWSALGYRRGADWLSLDSGCVWGRDLTLARLDPAAPDEPTLWQQPCR
ncbi:symmetrical bis(5'-nucleosyl)-tetraphosphatase [Thioalkalivibrio sp.]|uniref:symmetrical bis(5'-nucleosyl)-tetraphosphatase n=1 Tax=Thioalkalivibrio sp. TaxID=2093813 RepID=UPI00397672C1